MFYVVQDATLVHSILLSLATAFIVQIGYLFGQFCKDKTDRRCKQGRKLD
jgi:hypothetical protein